MNKKTLQVFMAIGLISFIAGIALTFNGKVPYGIGFTSLGVMWAIISFGQLRLLKNKAKP